MAKANTMRKVSLRNILANKLRLALTLLAVILGTSFVAGSFMFTNSLSRTFDSAVSNAFTGVDAAISGPGLGPETQQKLADDPMVDGVNIKSSQTVVVANKDAVAYQTGGGAALDPYYAPDATVGSPSEIVEGAAPKGTGEVIINDSAAEKYHIAVGDELVVVHPDRQDRVKVSGIEKPAIDAGGALKLRMDVVAFGEVYGSPQQLAVSAADGTTPEDLIKHLEEVYPDNKVDSGKKLEEDIQKALSSALKFVNYFLVAFGLIALLVGTFIIANTFSMIVAQRTKEFALLRALGASKGQISRSVVTESVIVGLIGSALGVGAGVGLVAIIKLFLARQGMEMGSDLGLSVQAVVVPLVLGTIVTVVSAAAPARKAGAVEPVEAMRSTESAAGSSLVARTVLGVIVLLVGAALAGWGVYTDDETKTRAIFVGVGAFAVIVGYFLAGPALSLPVVPTLGKIIGAPFGTIGSLAATNSRRNPRRTAATAFALTLGVALVTAIGMLGATMKSSVADAMSSDVSANYILSGPQQGNFPTPNETADKVRDVPGVTKVISMSTAMVAVDGQTSIVYGPHKQSMLLDGSPADMLNLKMVEGTAAFDKGFIATKAFAEKNNWKVGQSYPIIMGDENRGVKELGEIELKGIVEKTSTFENMLIVDDAVGKDARSLRMVGVQGEGENLKADLEAAVKDLVVVQVQTAEEFAGQAAGMINQMLAILYGLLALAVVIAVLGIINTLTLGVIERRQEIGMLRAVGTLRGQIRTMITLEAVQIAFFGALMGVAVGLGLGWSFIKVLADSGLDKITFPWLQIVAMLAGSGVVGIVAALWPASRAAKTPPLEAISA